MVEYYEPDTKLAYAIPGDDQGGCLFVYGKNRHASKIVFASAGFPDDQQGLAAIAVQLAAKHDCLVGIVCPPGFDDRPSDNRPWTSHPREGYRLQDITNCYHEALKVLKHYSTRRDAKLLYLLHDWGVVFGLQLANRHLKEEKVMEQETTPKQSPRMYAPDRIIILDLILGPHPSERSKVPKTELPPRPSLLQSIYLNFVGTSYRIVLAVIYLIYYYLGSTMATFGLKVFGMIFLPLQLGPGSPADDAFVAQTKNLPHVTYMCYVYYDLWKTILLGKTKKVFAGLYLPRLASTPVLFLYGTAKNAKFHPDATVALLQQEEARKKPPGGSGGGSSRVLAVENAGHWLHLQRPDVCMKEIGSFVDEM